MKNTSKTTKTLVRAATAGCIFCALNVMAATDDKKIISSTPVPAVKAPTVSAPVQAVKRKATIKVPVKPVVPKPRVPAPTQTTRPANPRPGDITRPTGPTRTVTPKVNIKTPVRTRPIQESAVKVLPPPNPPTRPQMQPRVNLKRPLGQVPPMSAGNYPPPWPPLNKPAQQSGFSVKRPENFAPRNLPRSQKGQILDPRYAPPLPGPSRIGSGSGRGNGYSDGRGNGYYSDDGYGRHNFGRTAYDPVAPRIPGNTAIRNPNFNDPRFQKIGKNRELFERMEDMERMKALQAGQEGLKAPWNRGAPDPAAGSAFEGHGPSNMNDYGANNMNERKAAGGNYLHAPGMPRSESGNSMQGPPRAGAVLDTSQQGWVSNTATTKEVLEDGTVIIVDTTTNDNGETTTTVDATDAKGNRSVDIQTTYSDGSMKSDLRNYDQWGNRTDTETATYDAQTDSWDVNGRSVRSFPDGTVFVERHHNGVPGTTRIFPGRRGDSQPNENYTKGNGGCGPGGWDVRTGGCRLPQKSIKQRTDEMTGQPSSADGGYVTNQPIIGPGAVTDYEHGDRRGGGGGFNPIDMRDPPKGVPGS